MAKQNFPTVGLIGKYSDPGANDTLARIATFMETLDRVILLDRNTAALFDEEHRMEVVNRRELGERADLIIVVGGDGTLLNAARSLADYAPRLVGVNLGRLGFLTDISPDHLEDRLEAVFEGHYHLEPRFLLRARIERDGDFISESNALNDVVIHKWDIARMIEVEAFVDGQYVYTTRADGLIVSTPTGSTAYALSGGGPILEPGLDAMVMVPICPHTLSNRPIVIGGHRHVTLRISTNSQPKAQLTCDGQLNTELVPGDRIHIEKRPEALRLLHPDDHDHYEILRAKLNWAGSL
ncbi:MAG: NAD(+) kinase [Pseudomonadota bacterium]